MTQQVSAIDRVELTDLNARFARALDTHQYAQLRGILAPDVHYVSGGGEFHDAEAVIENFQARAPGRTSRHGLGNFVVEPGPDGTVVGHSTWHNFATHDPDPTGVPIYMVADFTDRYRRTPDGWRIAERIITPVFRNPEHAPRHGSASGSGEAAR